MLKYPHFHALSLLRLPAIVLLWAGLLGSAWGGDRHAGYYYPEATSEETYVSQAALLPGSDRRRRILFITELTRQQLALPYPPDYALFAKGEEAEKLIITSLSANRLDTLYRLRGLLAMLTSQARATPIFAEFEVEDQFNFLDLLQLLGFSQLTVSDGEHFSHRIWIEPITPGNAPFGIPNAPDNSGN